MIDPRFEVDSLFSDEGLHSIELAIGRDLPEDYRAFAKRYGAAFVSGIVDGFEDLEVLSFLPASGETGIPKSLRLHPDLLEDKILPIADCARGNLYVLNKHNEVYYIDYYGGATSAIKVCESFEEFIALIKVEES